MTLILIGAEEPFMLNMIIIDPSLRMSNPRGIDRLNHPTWAAPRIDLPGRRDHHLDRDPAHGLAGK